MIRKLAAQRGLGHRTLSKKAGLGVDAIRNILRGRARSPRAKTMLAIAQALEVPVGVLYGTEAAPKTWKQMRRPLLTMGLTAADLDEGDNASLGAPPPPAPAPPGFLVVPCFDLRPLEDDAPEIMDPNRRIASSLTVPSDLVSAADANPAYVAAVRLREGMAPDIMAGAWVLVDTADRHAVRGVYVVWDGGSHAAVRVARLPPGEGPRVRITGSAGETIPSLEGYTVSGRVLARWALL